VVSYYTVNLYRRFEMATTIWNDPLIEKVLKDNGSSPDKMWKLIDGIYSGFFKRSDFENMKVKTALPAKVKFLENTIEINKMLPKPGKKRNELISKIDGHIKGGGWGSLSFSKVASEVSKYVEKITKSSSPPKTPPKKSAPEVKPGAALTGGVGVAGGVDESVAIKNHPLKYVGEAAIGFLDLEKQKRVNVRKADGNIDNLPTPLILDNLNNNSYIHFPSNASGGYGAYVSAKAPTVDDKTTKYIYNHDSSATKHTDLPEASVLSTVHGMLDYMGKKYKGENVTYPISITCQTGAFRYAVLVSLIFICKTREALEKKLAEDDKKLSDDKSKMDSADRKKEEEHKEAYEAYEAYNALLEKVSSFHIDRVEITSKQIEAYKNAQELEEYIIKEKEKLAEVERIAMEKSKSH
jgi:hypothetical protein